MEYVIKLQPQIIWKLIIICSEKDFDYYEIKYIELYKESLVNISEGGRRGDSVAANKVANIAGGKISGAIAVEYYR